MRIKRLETSLTMRTSVRKMNAKRMMTMTTMIMITLRTSSSHKTAHRSLLPSQVLPQLLKAMAANLYPVRLAETLSYPRIKRCRTFLMEIVRTRVSKSNGFGRKTCSGRTTSKRCVRWSSASANTESTRPEAWAPKGTRPAVRAIQMREAPRAPIRTWALVAPARASLPEPAFSKPREAII